MFGKPIFILILLLNCSTILIDCQQVSAPSDQPQFPNLVAVVEPGNTETSKAQSDLTDCIAAECFPRLLTNINVHHYDIRYIFQNINDTLIQGSVTINFTLNEETDQIIYHGKRFSKLSQPILLEDSTNHPVSMHLYPIHDYITLRSVSNVYSFLPNNYSLIQNFSVDLTDGVVGFFQVNFRNAAGKREKILATKFQPTDARKAFPCFDEPHLKAVFRVTIVHPPDTTALANFPCIEKSEENSLTRSVFAESFPMSTYLAAWAVLPEKYGKLVGFVDEKPINVWAREKPTALGHTTLALEIAIKSVEFFINYFNSSEALTPKIDLLAVPDFPTGAMENWGLVTFREDRIIFDETVVSRLQKQQLGETIAHEIAHFWFGNMVTCKWWDALWLNEAMATWLSFKPLVEHYSDWRMETQVLTEDLIPVMWDDSKPSSHPIVVANISRPADIISLFDSITYSKGSSILRMLEKIVGSDVFRDALRNFLNLNAFTVGDPTVFYNQLFTNISGEEFLRSWLEEANYPILRVDFDSNENGSEIRFSQSRFIISNALDASMLNNDYRWKIHIECLLGVSSENRFSSNKTIKLFLEAEQETVFLENQYFDWIKCNRDFTGFFITLYSNSNLNISFWEQFASIIETQPTIFSVEDKVNLLHDSFLLAYKGLIDYIEPLKICKALLRSGVNDFVIWRSFQWHWELLADLIEYLPETWAPFRQFAIEQVLQSGTNITELLETDINDDHNSRLSKGLKFSFLCRLRHPEAIEKAHELFKSIPIEYFLEQNVKLNISPDYLSTVYICHLANDENVTDWSTMYHYYKNAISPQEQTRALVAISSISNKHRLNRLLHDALYGGAMTIKRQDFFLLLTYMSRHPVGRDTAWTFYKKNFQRLVSLFTLENRRLGTVLGAMTRSFENPSFLEDLLAFQRQHPKAGAGANARKMATDQVNMNLEWIQYREENLRNALEAIKNY